MRILVVVPEHYRAGRTRRGDRMRALVAALTDHEYDAEVATVRWWDQRRDTHHDRWATYRAVGRSRLSLPRVANRIHRYKPDVVHLVDVPSGVALTASYATSAPVVYEAMGLDTPLASGRLNRRASAALATVIVPSEVVTTQLLAAGIDAPIEPIPDPVDFEMLRSVTPAPSTDVVWSSRSLVHAYLDDLLLALAELGDRGGSATLFLGDGRDRAREAVEEYHLGGRVEVSPWSTRRDRLAGYRGATTYVHTADECAFATELLWALAAGCAGLVHLRPRSSAHELVLGHDRGIRVTTPGELVDGLDQAASMVTSTIDPTLAGFDTDAVAARYREVYDRALSRGG